MGFQAILLEPAREVLILIGQFLGKAIAMLFILVIGWWISKIVKQLVTRVLRAIKFDDIAASTGIDAFLSKGGIKYSLSELIGVICYWLLLLVTFMVALSPFQLLTPSLLDKAVSYVPNVITAIFIVILGMFVSSLLKNIIQTAATNAGIAHANILSKFAEVAVIVFVIGVALVQLNIAANIIQLLIGIILGSIGLAIGLSFGLGCRDIAGRYTNEFIDKLKSKK